MENRGRSVVGKFVTQTVRAARSRPDQLGGDDAQPAVGADFLDCWTRQLRDQVPIALRLEQLVQPGVRGLAPFFERREHRCDRVFQIGIDLSGPSGDQRRRHVTFAGGAGLSAEPRQVAPEEPELRGVDYAREQFDRRAQAPGRDAQLMQRLRLARLGRGLIAQQRFDAERDRLARRVGDGFSGGKRYSARRRIGARSIYHPAIPYASIRRRPIRDATCRWRRTDIRRCVFESRPATPRSAGAHRPR